MVYKAASPFNNANRIWFGFDLIVCGQKDYRFGFDLIVIKG